MNPVNSWGLPVKTEKRMTRLSELALFVTVAAMCGTASAASPWFSGYLDPSNNYRYYAFSDWDTPLFGAGILPDSDLYGIAAPDHLVDGHVIFEADGTGSAKVIETTGSYSTLAGFTLGSVQPISFQFSNWFSNPGYVPVNDTRHDYSAEFLNIVSGQVPEPASLTAMALGSVALLARRRR
jgi:PEP-CTERM motif